MSITTEALLKSVLSQPTAPYRELWVRAELARLLNDAGVKSFVDTTGNLIAGAGSFAELKRGSWIGLMAHMDHPGFHLGPRIGKNRYRCLWYGGAPFKEMKAARVRVHDPKRPGVSAAGVITKMDKVDLRKDRLPFEVEFKSDISAFSKGSFGSFDFPGFSQKGDRVITRGADDLAGCVIAAGALIDEAARRKRSQGSRRTARLFAIFTRAEEVGFVGCTDLLLKNKLPRKAWYISLEASRALPEAELGQGPVLRIGDLWTIFDPEISYHLHQAALRLQTSVSPSKTRGAKAFYFQRRLMSGGVCEATPLSVFGFRVSALAVPLMNYHNQPLSGRKRGPQPEIISVGDTELARRLCAEFPRLLAAHPGYSAVVKKKVLKAYESTRKLLARTPAFELGS